MTANNRAEPSSKSVRFRTTILQAGKTATGIQIPDDVIAKLGTSKKPPVRVTINGFTYRSTVAVMGGKFMVGVNADNREKARIAGGDTVTIDIALDEAPRTVSVPAALRAALAKNATAKKKFDQLSYSKKRVYTVPIEKAKTDETRDRNIARVIAALSRAE
jgi:hypothetical protein